jgi:hypothetical protein
LILERRGIDRSHYNVGRKRTPRSLQLELLLMNLSSQGTIGQERGSEKVERVGAPRAACCAQQPVKGCFSAPPRRVR